MDGHRIFLVVRSFSRKYTFAYSDGHELQFALVHQVIFHTNAKISLEKHV